MPPPKARFVPRIRAPPGARGLPRPQAGITARIARLYSSHLSFNKCELFSDILLFRARMFRTPEIGERTCRGALHNRNRCTPRRRRGSSPVSGHCPASGGFPAAEGGVRFMPAGASPPGRRRGRPRASDSSAAEPPSRSHGCDSAPRRCRPASGKPDSPASGSASTAPAASRCI